MLAKLKRAIIAGKPINELEAIYLPLFHSKNLTPTKLFIESAELIKSAHMDDSLKQKVLTLLITISGKIVNRAELLALAEEVRIMGNVVIEVFEELGREEGRKKEKEDIARKMLVKDMDVLDVIDVTGLSTERVREIRDAVRVNPVSV